MNVFQVKYHKCGILRAALIGIPTLGALIMLTMLLCFPFFTPAWLISFLIISFLLFMIFVLKWIIKKQIFVPCHVSIDRQGIKFEILTNSLFYSKKIFQSTWANISSIEERFSIQNGNYSYAIGFKNPQFKAHFSIDENFEEEAENFFKTLRFYQEIKKISIIFQQSQSSNHFPDELASS